MGENVYGLTAIRTNQENSADHILSLNFTEGNNFFYWPSGSNGLDENSLGNIYNPILLNASNLVLNRTVSGSNYMDSDLFFIERDNTIEGAWLQGHRKQLIDDEMSIILNSSDKTEFLFPWVGFNINAKNLSFKSYSLNDSSKTIYQKLDPNLRSAILADYYNSVMPNSAVFDIYLNQTNLVNNGAHSAFLSNEADTITVTPSSKNLQVWNDSIGGKVESAFLYKFIKTDIYVKPGMVDIHWPIQSFESGSNNLSMSLSSDTCNPIVLGSIDPSQSMVGAIAGLTFNTSDVIYKTLSNGGTPIEAAWLGSGSINQLNQIVNVIPIYDKPAINCAEYIDGPIQPALYTRMESGKFNSFIWMDKDTPANDVFYYHDHDSTCAYGRTFPHNFFKDQDYQNPSPLNAGKNFPLTKTPCTCRSIYYSPIGTEGTAPKQYNSMPDLLFADPQGLGEDFSYSNWKDTRNYTPSTSPQFSFFKINGKKDTDVGFGDGQWITGTGVPMILKTGRRYCYYRSNFRINEQSGTECPYLFVKYPYKNLSITCGPNYSSKVDLVILIDNSRTQYYDIEIVKDMAKSFCEIAIQSNPESLISIISFSEKGILLNYLSNDLSEIIKNIDGIKIPKKYPEWLTNISDGLILANNVLHVVQPVDNNCSRGDISLLCRDLRNQIVNQSNIGTITNCPRADAIKHVLLFSDGQETVNEGTAEIYAQILKQNNTTITTIDIGYYALTDKLMKKIASDDLYFNLQEYLLYTDIDINKFIANIATLLMGCFPATPMWCKAKRDDGGNWIGLRKPSDMSLNAGEYFAYVHKTSIDYTSNNTFTNFSIPGLSFTLNVKLDGWDYYTNTYHISSRGYEYGAKPFWGKTNTPSATALPFSGGGRIMDEYVVLHQPIVSDLILKNGNFVQYKNIGRNFINWHQKLTFEATYTDQKWNKMNIKKGQSFLSSTLDTRNLSDYIIEQTNETSNIYLESYSTLNPSKYIFYIGNQNKPFNYTERLYYINRCNTSFVTFTSGIVIETVQPYCNLNNVHYPTIANVSFPSSFINNSHTGVYLLPDRLGIPYYRGVGYTIDLDPKSISNLDTLSMDYMFLDINKYGSRNRGLTKKDQITPVEIKNITNSWIIEPYSSGKHAGTIIETLNNQKFTPYQTNYEINPNNQIGLCLQKDSENFWNTKYYKKWASNKPYPLTFRNELILGNFLDKMDTLLTDCGIQSEWKTDIYGNNFGLYKSYGMETSKYILTENRNRIIAECGLRLESE